MPTEKKLTGYPSIDKPWLKYYSEEAINTPITELSIYEYLLECTKGRNKSTALVYIGRKISYQTMFDSIENIAKAFSRLGLRKGDVVACISPSFPETIYSFYAANKLGATSDYFDPRTEPQAVYDELMSTNPKILLIFEGFISKYKKVIDKANIPNIIVISARDSLHFPLKMLAMLKRKSIPVNYKYIAKIIAHTKKLQPVKTVGNIANEVALIEHTGGTTGTPKGSCLTNKNVNAVVQQYGLGGNQCLSSESWLNVCCPFAAYSIICGQHLPLIYGMSNLLCFTYKPKDVTKIVIKNKLNHMSNTPLIWEEIIHNKSVQEVDFSFMVNPTVGADSLSIEKEIEINKFLQNHNCKYDICKGYGMTEVGSAVSVTSPTFNKVGSVGIPFTHTVISIFDTETGAELKYGEQGEICISGPSVMKGYYNNSEETDKVLKVHKDGKVWMHSGDIGHMDEDGFLFIDGRIKRMIINHHGFKNFPPEIEKVLSKHKKLINVVLLVFLILNIKQGKLQLLLLFQSPIILYPPKNCNNSVIAICLTTIYRKDLFLQTNFHTPQQAKSITVHLKKKQRNYKEDNYGCLYLFNGCNQGKTAYW